MPYKLYFSPGAASMAVHWMLLHIGVPFEAVRIDLKRHEQKSPSYLALNPYGVVPTLVVDGVAHRETGALLMLLAERHSDANLAPPFGAQRAAYLQCMFQLAGVLMPAFRSWFYAHETAGPDLQEISKPFSAVRVEASWTLLNAQLSDERAYIIGDDLTAADFLATILIRWSRHMPANAEAWPWLGAYAQRMRLLPSLKEVHAREGLAEWI